MEIVKTHPFPGKCQMSDLPLMPVSAHYDLGWTLRNCSRNNCVGVLFVTRLLQAFDLEVL